MVVIHSKISRISLSHFAIKPMIEHQGKIILNIVLKAGLGRVTLEIMILNLNRDLSLMICLLRIGQSIKMYTFGQLIK